MTTPASCPLPELTFASRMETLPPGVQERVAAHVEGCEACQALLEAFDEPDIADPTPEERLRIRARVTAAIAAESPAAGRRRGEWKWPAVAAAVLMAAAASVFVSQRGNQQLPPTDASTTSLQKAALPGRTGQGFVWRGVDPGAAQDLARALEPYSVDDFARAARELEAFVDRYPQNPAGHFYLGVSRLFLGADADAVTALERAEPLAREDANLVGESAWYLALAYQRVNQPERAAGRLDTLCRSRHARSIQACEVLRKAAAAPTIPRSK